MICLHHPQSGEMSDYENVVAGKLRLKGKALEVKSNGIKTKKKHKHQYDLVTQVTAGGNNPLTTNQLEDDLTTKNDDHLTPAERKYLEQWEKLNIKRLAKEAKKSHRDRIQEFNRYLANLTEHYDIPKVGPG
ncbi:protein FAM32A-like isoform X1 [Solanum pennellii]|uniref:Protein FAM32A-like isoform X1 n=1 Tax=Solanum pennellii TaxID=28526 RepID=A0ABM1VH18_SOLPN|nr:protein FAM32A-like isoform X1 [Solanum pennellii]